MTMRIRALVFAASLFIAGGALAQTSHIEIGSAWARATPGGATSGVVYLTIRSPSVDRLVSAASPVAGKAELHSMAMAGMVMKMRPLAGLAIPAGRPVTLEPGGNHIMLLGLKQPLRAGQSFPLTLTFAKAGPRVVTVAVEKPGAMSAGPAATP